MKKILASSLLITSSIYAVEVKFNLEGRVDYVNQKQTFKPATGAESKNTDSAFKFNRLRINMTGAVNESLSYRIRYAPLTNEAAGVIRDSSTDRLEMYYIDHKSAYFTTRFGKQFNLELLGRETIASGSDQFLNSRAFSLHHSDLGNYKTGLSLMFTQLEGHTFTLNAHTPNKTVSDTTLNKKNTGMGLGAYYSGGFMDKALQPHIGYTMDTQNYDGAGEKNRTFKTLSVGNRLVVAGFTLDTDYRTYTKPSATNVKEETKSIYTNLAYTINEFTPFVTFINDKYDTAGANAVVTTAATATTTGTDYKRNAIGVGTFYKPFADTNFRYHLLYTTDKTEFEGQTGVGIKELVDNKFYFGFKADI